MAIIGLTEHEFQINHCLPKIRFHNGPVQRKTAVIWFFGSVHYLNTGILKPHSVVLFIQHTSIFIDVRQTQW